MCNNGADDRITEMAGGRRAPQKVNPDRCSRKEVTYIIRMNDLYGCICSISKARNSGEIGCHQRLTQCLIRRSSLLLQHGVVQTVEQPC